MNPEQLFELFSKSVRKDMSPFFIGRHNSEGMYRFWHERFMNAYYGIQESRDLQSWAEAPQMWLAAYREFSIEQKKLYEVGTFEQYEEGFHAFYRTHDETRAEFIKQIAESLQQEGYERGFEESNLKNQQFQQKTGKEFNISSYSKDMYKIQIREVELDA